MSLPINIVAATDFSDFAEKGVRHALALAKASGGRVHLVHCWGMPVMAADEAALYNDELVQGLETAAEQAMSAMVERLTRELPTVEGLVLAGDPRDVVPRVAAEKHADLIVLGTHGRHGLRRMLLGSVAEAIARHAPCSVTIIR